MPIQPKANLQGSRLLRVAAAVVFVCALSLAGRALAQGSSAHDRIYVVTHVDIVPPNTADGTKLVQQYVADSRKDKGLVEIEAGAQISRANHISVYEVWQDQKAFDAHVAADHTRQFRKQIDPMLGSPYDERLHSPLE